MLVLEAVTKEFVLDEEHVIIPVRKVNLDVERGQFVMIIGRSGSGKTTLLNLAAGLMKPSSGRVLFDGTDLRQMDEGDLAELRNRRMGIVFQFPSLMTALNASENVAMPVALNRLGRAGRDATREAKDLLHTMGLADRITSYPKQLSAGEQKRVVIARSLINKPDLILADEPTSDLDAQTEKEIMELLKEICAGGVGVVMVTHSLDLVPYADCAFKMENGSLVEVKMKGKS